jgi:hypothetical protein
VARLAAMASHTALASVCRRVPARPKSGLNGLISGFDCLVFALTVLYVLSFTADEMTGSRMEGYLGFAWWRGWQPWPATPPSPPHDGSSLGRTCYVLHVEISLLLLLYHSRV